MPQFTDGFDEGRLDPDRWVDHYLPQWTTPERSRARYDLDADGLLLRIDADQPPWRDEDGPMRVSNLQTATFSGPLGSDRGTHHHAPGLRVRTEVPTRRLWTPSAGRVEAVLEASPDPACMLAVWLVGVEESSPDDSGEITVAELFGSLRGERRSIVRTGVKAVNDPRLVTDVVDVDLPIDTAEPHRYAAEWSEAGVALFVDGALVHTVAQSLRYPLQLMVDLFEFPEEGPRDPAPYPRTARARSVRGTPATEFHASFIKPYTVRGSENMRETSARALDDAMHRLRAGSTAHDLENQHLDFKVDGRSAEDDVLNITEAAACFANASGGLVIVGVHDRVAGLEAIIGSRLDPERTRSRIYELTEPALLVDVVARTYGDVSLVVIDVPASVTVHSVKSRIPLNGSAKPACRCPQIESRP